MSSDKNRSCPRLRQLHLLFVSSEGDLLADLGLQLGNGNPDLLHGVPVPEPQRFFFDAQAQEPVLAMESCLDF